MSDKPTYKVFSGQREEPLPIRFDEVPIGQIFTWRAQMRWVIKLDEDRAFDLTSKESITYDGSYLFNNYRVAKEITIV